MTTHTEIIHELGDDQLPGKQVTIRFTDKGLVFAAHNGLVGDPGLEIECEWHDLYDFIEERLTPQ